MNSDFPKVLIIGQYFDVRPGNRVTMTNLFRGWDKEKIACAAEDMAAPDFNICDKYYQIGDLERRRNFPFNMVPKQKSIKSGLLKVKIKQSNPIPLHIDKSNLRKKYENFLDSTGLIHYKSRYVVSEEFIKWVKEFSPDCIYSQLSNLELILFVNAIHKATGIPVAVHIMDDWPSTISKKGAFQSFWYKKIDKNFRKLLSNTTIFMSICEAMSKEYLSRYGHTFLPFHNPIDSTFWGKYQKQNYELSENPTILYAGRIGVGVEKSLELIGQAVDKLNNTSHTKIKFIIKTNLKPSWITKFSCVEFQEMESHDKMPKIFSNADFLILPFDFSNESTRFTKYSMPTKATEYMISGTPIIIFAPEETALVDYAKTYNIASIVTEENPNILAEEIMKLINSIDKRIEISQNSKEIALTKHDAKIVTQSFKELLGSTRFS